MKEGAVNTITSGSSEQAAVGKPRRGSVREVLGVAFKLGLTSFGGPIAHIGYFRAEYVQRRDPDPPQVGRRQADADQGEDRLTTCT
jgi:hypothetical protein